MYSYDKHGRRIGTIRWGDADHYPYAKMNMDSFCYDERGLLELHQVSVWDTSMRWLPSQRELYTYDAANRLVLKTTQFADKGMWNGSFVDTICYDSEGRMLSETSYNVLGKEQMHSRHSMAKYRYQANTVLADHYNPDTKTTDWHLIATDSACYDAQKNKIVDMHIFYDAPVVQGLGAVRDMISHTNTSYHRNGDHWMPSQMIQDTRDSRGLLTSTIISLYDYDKARWQKEMATYYQYEAVK